LRITAAALRLLDVGSEAFEVLRVKVQAQASGKEGACESELKNNMKAEILGEDAVWLRHMVSISKKGTGSQV